MLISILADSLWNLKISTRNSIQLITATLRMAYGAWMPGENLISDSKQGLQYTSDVFWQLLKKWKIKQSFSNARPSRDNAVIESFLSLFKKEEFYRSAYRSKAELRKKIDKYIVFYNQKRPHTTLNYQTPEQYEDAFLGKDKSFFGKRGSDSWFSDIFYTIFIRLQIWWPDSHGPSTTANCLKNERSW